MDSAYYNASSAPPVVVQGHAVDPKTMMPVYAANAANHPEQWSKGEEQPKRCRDVIWAILFYAHLVAMAVVAATYVPQMTSIMAKGYAGGNEDRRLMLRLRFLEGENENDNSNNWYNNNYGGDNNNNGDVDINVGATMTVLIACCCSALVLATLSLGFMIEFAEQLIKTSLIFSVVLSILAGLLSLAVGGIGGALGGLMMSGLLVWYACGVWGRIPFAATNLAAATASVRANLGVALYAYLSLFLAFGWAVWWTASTISTVFVVSDCESDGTCEKEINGLLIFVFFISYYWTMQVISNVVHVTVSGVVATWWFHPLEANTCCSQAVRDSYFRSMTYSFGSICLGSLIVAIISALRELMHQVRENGDSMMACVGECILSCIARLVEYFNKWAFVYVGIYGYSFMEAGMNVMALFKSRGWTTIITDDLADRALLIVSFCVAVLNGLFAVLIAAVINIGQGIPLFFPFIIGFIVGISLSSTLFSVVGSGVNSVIVLYAEAPNEFQQNHPELSEKMRAAWRQAWPVEFQY